VAQVELERGRADPEGELALPERVVAVEGQVGPQQRRDRRGQERDAAGGLVVEEVREGAGDPAGTAQRRPRAAPALVRRPGAQAARPARVS
jgi:hypothetical protein